MVNRTLANHDIKSNELRCPECNKMLGKYLDNNKIDIKISKGGGRGIQYRIHEGSVSVKCICGMLCYLTKRASYPIT